MLGMAPATLAGSGARALALEVLPQLQRIAAPPLRPVSRHLYSPAEQEAVRCGAACRRRARGHACQPSRQVERLLRFA